VLATSNIPTPICISSLSMTLVTGLLACLLCVVTNDVEHISTVDRLLGNGCPGFPVVTDLHDRQAHNIQVEESAAGSPSHFSKSIFIPQSMALPLAPYPKAQTSSPSPHGYLSVSPHKRGYIKAAAVVCLPSLFPQMRRRDLPASVQHCIWEKLRGRW